MPISASLHPQCENVPIDQMNAQVTLGMLGLCLGGVLVAGERAAGMSPCKNFVKLLQSDLPLATAELISASAITYLRGGKPVGPVLLFLRFFCL